MYIDTYVLFCFYFYVFISFYIYIYVFIYIHKNKHVLHQWQWTLGIFQPQTESGTKELFLNFFVLFFMFSCFILFPNNVKLLFSFFHFPIMCKCRSHFLIMFPSCAVLILIKRRKRIEAESETKKLIYTK